MKPSVIIRPYREEDLQGLIICVKALTAHERAFLDRMKSPDDMGENYVRRIQTDTTDAEGLILVAESSGEIVGYCTLLTRLNTADVRDEVYYEYAKVGDIGVLESHRGKGIGAMMLRECETRAKSVGIKWISLGVLAGNADARRFYAANGYRELGIELEKPL
jgi:ribosomal protein S18 acetylase RimI-like enzyme